MCESRAKPEPESFREKQKKAEDLLTGLILYRPDLGADGEALVQLLLSARQNQTSSQIIHRKRLH